MIWDLLQEGKKGAKKEIRKKDSIKDTKKKGKNELIEEPVIREKK